jgi:hypothetical protein
MKFSLAQQIEEVDRELKQRAAVYPRLISSNPSRRSELEFHVARLEAVKASLEWLQANETDVRGYVEARKVKEGEAS